MRTLILLAGLPSIAIAQGRIDPPGAGANEALHGDVLVWNDARLYVEPDDTAPFVQLAAIDGVRKDRVGHGFPMHVLSSKAAFVEVEPTTGFDCAWARMSTGDLAKVHLFVKREDLAPVVTKKVMTTFTDGTAIELRPGAPVVPLTNGTFAITLFGDEPIVPIDRAAIGHSYTPQVFSERNTNDKLALNIHAHVTVALRSFEIMPRLDEWTTDAVTTRDGARLFTLKTACERVQVAVQATDVTAWQPPPAADVGKLGALGALRSTDAFYLPAGTALTTASGHRIAVARNVLFVPHPSGTSDVCVDVAVGLDRLSFGAPIDKPAKTSGGRLTVCAPAKHARQDPAEASGTGNLWK